MDIITIFLAKRTSVCYNLFTNEIDRGGCLPGTGGRPGRRRPESVYRVAIVEDVPEDSAQLQEHLTRYQNEHGVEFGTRAFSNGLSFIEDYKPVYDVVLMDVEMPHMNGIEAAGKLREVDEDVSLIFVTGMAKYAIEGYSVRALDFILKPVEYMDFSLKLKKALAYRDRFQKNELILSTANGMRRLQIDDVYYVEVMNHTLVYHTRQGDIAERGAIKNREELLEQYDFARCNNSFLVNLRYVQSMTTGTVVVQNRTLPIGRTKKKEFLRRLTEFMGAQI